MTHIAYLTSLYPAMSHTFILREVAGLRKEGLEVSTYSVRRSPSEQHIGPEEVAEAASTFAILPDGLNIKRLFSAFGAAIRHPKALWAATKLALKTRSPGIKASIYQVIYLVEAILLAQDLRAKGITHIHAHFASACASVAVLAAELAEIPFSFTLHGPSDLAEPGLWRLDEKIARARFVSCISYYARSQAMLQSDPAHWGKLEIIRCAIEPERYTPTPQPDGPVHLAFVGRLAPVKGLRVLVDAFQRLLETVPSAQLTIVGDGPDRSWLEENTKNIPGITLTGALSQDRVAEVLAQSHALVLPSFAEGVPVVLMEAMAAGRPVIATQVAGVSELVETGVNGLIVSPGHEDALVEALKTLALDSDLRSEMGQAGRAKVHTDFNIATEAGKLAALFRA